MSQETSQETSATPDRPPGPPGVRLSTLRGMTTDAPGFLTALRDRYGPLVLVPLGPKTMYLLSDPEAIGEVLIAAARGFDSDILGKAADGSGGEAPLARLLGRGLLTSIGRQHRKQRKMIQPLFHRQRVAGYVDAFADIAEGRVAGWADGARLDVLVEMVELTMAVVTRTIFDVGLDSDISRRVRTALPRNDGPLRWALVPGGELLSRLPLPSNRQFLRGRDELYSVVHELIAQRRAGGATGTDLLSMLLQARDGETGEPMADEQVRDEVLTLLMAGHDTTANSLAWALHLLSVNPEAADQLYAEVDAVLGDRLPTYADVPELTWTRAVFNEALRIYPPVWTVARRALAGHTVLGTHLPANSTVVMSPWVVHRDPRWWPAPERYAPQRWVERFPDGSTDNLTGTALSPDRPRFSYFPFGGGPRQCIGNEFAQLEGVIVLATIARKWRMAPVPDHPVEAQAKVIVRPRGGLPMRVLARR